MADAERLAPGVQVLKPHRRSSSRPWTALTIRSSIEASHGPASPYPPSFRTTRWGYNRSSRCCNRQPKRRGCSCRDFPVLDAASNPQPPHWPAPQPSSPPELITCTGYENERASDPPILAEDFDVAERPDHVGPGIARRGIQHGFDRQEQRPSVVLSHLQRRARNHVAAGMGILVGPAAARQGHRLGVRFSRCCWAKPA